MAGIREVFEIVDKATAPLRQVERAMGAVVNQTTNVNIQMRDFATAQTQASDSMRQANTMTQGLTGSLGKLAASYLTIKSVMAMLHLSDELSMAQTRLNNINDGMQTTAELQEMIYRSAQRSRGEYLQTMQTVASLKAQTGETFASVQEAVAFTELLNKQFKIAGADATAISSTMYNLTQALSTGVLRGNDLNIVMSNAPQIAQRIAKEMGITVGQLKEIASQGNVTADIVKNAILGSADEINEQFEQMPMTFGDAIVKMQNMAVRAFQPIGDMIAQAINTQQVEDAINGIGQALYVITAIAGQLISFTVDGFSMIWGALQTVTAGFGGMGQVGVAVVGVLVGSFVAGEAIILNVIAVIGNFFITLCETMQNNWANSVYDAQERIIKFASGSVRAFAGVVRGAENAANAIANAFIAGANAAIGGINGLINAINQIPGVNLSTVSEVSAAAPNHNLSSQIEAVAASLEAMKPDAPVLKMYERMETYDVGDAFNAGKNAGENWFSGVLDGMKGQGDFGSFGNDFSAATAGGDGSGLMPNGGNVGKVGKVGKVDNVKLSDEDMKIYRDLAERRYMNNIELKTLAPEITVNLPAGASGNLSPQDVADKLKRMLIEQMSAQTAVAHGGA